MRAGATNCYEGSKLGVFPIAVDGLTAVVEDEPWRVSIGPALGISLPRRELRPPRVTREWERGLGRGDVEFSETFQYRLNKVVNRNF